MKKIYTVLAIVATTAVNGQTWYQKEKSFHHFIAGAGAIGGMELFKDIKAWQGQGVWTGFEGGIANKNTSIGASITSYEYNKAKETYIGLVVQRRLFYIGRFEPWLSVAYGIPLEGKPEFKFQPALRGRFQLHKAVAVELSYQKTLAKSQNFSPKYHQGLAAGVIISFHGNVNSNNK